MPQPIAQTPITLREMEVLLSLHGDRRRSAIRRLLPRLLAEAQRAVLARFAVLELQNVMRCKPDPVLHITSAIIAPIAEVLGMQRREQPLVVSSDDAPRIIRP